MNSLGFSLQNMVAEFLIFALLILEKFPATNHFKINEVLQVSQESRPLSSLVDISHFQTKMELIQKESMYVIGHQPSKILDRVLITTNAPPYEHVLIPNATIILKKCS